MPGPWTGHLDLVGRDVRLTLYRYESGIETASGNRVVYDVAAGEARFGAASVAAQALVWELGHDGPAGAQAGEARPAPTASAEVELDPGVGWLMRCDRVHFAPGGVAYRHTHPGPGIRCLLHGSITIEGPGGGVPHRYGPLEAWFEGADYPVLATASPTEETGFVRVMLLPREWRGKRTIHYVDPADAERPKTQRATVFLEHPIDP